MEKVKQNYEKRQLRYKKLLVKQKHSINFISALRMIIFVFAILVCFISYYKLNNYFILWGSLVINGIIFTALLVKHTRFINRRKITEKICEINKKAIKRVKGDWRKFNDTGEEFINEKHEYSNDLDVFGKASLFQYINETTTQMGRDRLRYVLENPNTDVENIIFKQEALKEISKNVALRQRISAEGLCIEDNKDVKELIKWGQEKGNLNDDNLINILTIFLPVITIPLIVMGFLKYINMYVPILFVIIHMAILRINKDERQSNLDLVYQYKKVLTSYENMFKIIGKCNFKSEYLKSVKSNIVYKKQNVAEKSIRELKNISSKISDRSNLFYMILNTLFFWDYKCVKRLDDWKNKYGDKLEKWLNTLGEIEHLSSISIINYENPKWTFPKFKSNHMEISGKNIGHPLIGKSRVCNDFNIGKNGKVILITGSNMSGKSTFLRTIGINLLLAEIGSVVCADEFLCMPMEIYTCMRISDNLEERISSFYGEIIRIKSLINKVKLGRPILFLLDEIFKGTNSLDRHTGAKILINKLTQSNAIGLVSTHDLELWELEKKNSKIKNYHFEEYYKNNKIYFDYKLKKGVSTTRNAMYLMKMAGIE